MLQLGKITSHRHQMFQHPAQHQTGVSATRGVQNRTNPIETPQTEPTQTKTAKNRIWFGCNRIIFLLNRMVWFGLRFSFYQSNRTKPNRNIRIFLIKHISSRQILIETQ